MTPGELVAWANRVAEIARALGQSAGDNSRRPEEFENSGNFVGPTAGLLTPVIE